ncbi:DMT family transporter [beta proteobacterium MWH-UniP1]
MTHQTAQMGAALAFFVAGGFCLSSIDAMGKLVISEVSLLLLVWARYIGQVAISLPLSYRFAGKNFWKSSRPRLQLVRSVLLASTTVLFFSGVQYLPLAEAAAISFTAPIWVALLSAPMLNEQVARSDKWVAAIGFSGILLIVRPGTDVFHFGALLIGLMAFLNAIFQLLTRKLTEDNPFTTFFYSGLVGAIGASVLLLTVGIEAMPSIRQILLLAGIGVFGGLGHLLFVLAFYRAPPATLTPFVYLQMVWAIGLGWLVFATFPDNWSLLGMAVIVGSGLWLVQHRHRKRSKLA